LIEVVDIEWVAVIDWLTVQMIYLQWSKSDAEPEGALRRPANVLCELYSVSN